MSTTTFRRHQRALIDRAIHRIFGHIGHRHAVADTFTGLLHAARKRSNLLEAAAVRDGGVMRFVQLDALLNLARFHAQTNRFLDDWPGAHGHPVAVIHSMAQYLHGTYRTPRFLGSVWFGDGTADCRRKRDWFIAHANGTRFRSLPLPMVMTRRMEHVFLRTPDHVPFDTALRRAEILGLGGSDALVDAVVATRLGREFLLGGYWRDAMAWLVRREDELAPGDVGTLVEHLYALRDTPTPLAGRTVASLLRDDRARRFPPRPARAHAYVSTPPPLLTWPKSRWGDEHVGGWKIVELLCSAHLIAEGARLRHCVGNYGWRCHQRSSTIWSMRRAGSDEPVLTIELDLKLEAINMVRGHANRTGTDAELAVVSTWAARLGLGATGSYARELEVRAGARPAA